MLLSSLTIKTRLILLAALALAFELALGGYCLDHAAQLNRALEAQLRKAAAVDEAVNSSRQAEVAFKKQVQEWKNVLLRGNDKASFDKYLAAFREEAAAVQMSLGVLAGALRELGMDPAKVEEAARLHEGLKQSYQKGLESYDPANPEAGKVVDKLVKGIDRPATAAMDEIVGSINEFSRAMRAKALEDAAAAETKSRLSTIAVIAVAMLLLSVLCFVVIRSIVRPLASCAAFARDVAGGNLDARLALSGRDEVATLADSLRTMIGTLRGMIAQAEAGRREAGEEAARATQAMGRAEEESRRAEAGRAQLLRVAAELEQVSAELAASAGVLSTQAEEASAGARTQNRRLDETATAMEEMNSTVLEVARNAGEAAQSAEVAREAARSGSEFMSGLVAAIGEVEAQTESLKQGMAALDLKAEGIGRIMGVISDIADQTNLLALNAAIEAARAGDAGRGFAVVADEVRKLAEKTMTATKEVGEAVQGIQGGTRASVGNVEREAEAIGRASGLVGNSREILERIQHLVDDVAGQIQAIASASEEQSATSEEINRAVEDINTISLDTATAMSRSADAVSGLSAQARNLEELIRTMRGQG